MLLDKSDLHNYNNKDEFLSFEHKIKFTLKKFKKGSRKNGKK